MSLATFFRQITTPAFKWVHTLDMSFRFRKFLNKSESLKLAFALNSTDPANLPIGRSQFQLRTGTMDQFAFREIFQTESLDTDFLGIDVPTTIVDCGAHIGSASLYFSLKFPTSKITAIEPDADNYKLLKANTEQYPNICTINAAVWDSSASVTIVDSNSNTTGRSVREVGTSESGSIPGLTLNEIFDQQNLGMIDILKIDVEGAEKRLFSSPSVDSWLRRVRVLIVEPHDRFIPGCAKAIFKALEPFDYEVHGRSDILIFKIKK